MRRRSVPWRQSMMLMAMPIAATSCTVTSTPSGNGPSFVHAAPPPVLTPRARDLATLRTIAGRAATLRSVYGQLLIALGQGDSAARGLAHRYSTQAAKLSGTSFTNDTVDLARAKYTASVITLSVDLQALTRSQLKSPGSSTATQAAALARSAVRDEASAELGFASTVSRRLRHSGISHLNRALAAAS